MMGETISHYVIREKLGEGGMGVVYKAVDTRLDRTVALKFLAPHLLRNDDARRRFEQEAKTAASLNHPNICTLYEIDEADGHTFLALEYIDGEGLDEIAGRGPLPAAQAADYAAQAARGLAAAHAKGIVHRDIKGGNIMVTADGLVKVMDFGLARLTSDARLTQDGTVLGTPAYMAPEQLEGIDVDARADVWALGVVFYEMLAGQVPFKAEYQQALLYAVMHEQPEPLADAPEELSAIVAKALEKDLSARYADAAEMGAAIEAFVDAERSSAATFPPLKQAGGEWTSKQRLFGLPLVHIATGFDPLTGRARIAKGIIAIGGIAVGGFAVGGISLGAFAIGGIAAGITSVGGVALALWMAFGAVTVGMDPQGVVAIGPEGTRVMEQTIVEQAASSEKESEPPSVAVMPFVNSSGDPDFEYFSDGMTDELINALSKIKGLKVVARSSVFRLKGQELAVGEIGERLNVGAVLEGTVRKAGDRLRITTQLINADDGFEIWSDRYDSQMKDVFEVQDEICRAMVGALEAELLDDPLQPVVRAATQNPKAYELYLRGQSYFQRFTEADVEQSRSYFEEALRIDPNYALARVWLANSYTFRVGRGIAPAEDLATAEAELSKALQLDDSIALAHASMGVAQIRRWNWVSAERSLERALALEPGLAIAHFFHSIFLRSVGRIDEALEAARQAVALNPLNSEFRGALVSSLVTTGRYEEAHRQAEDLIRLNEGSGYQYLAEVHSAMGRFDEAVEALERSREVSRGEMSIEAALAVAYGKANRPGDARNILDALLERRRESYFSAYSIGLVHLALGEDDPAFTWFETAFEERTPSLPSLRWTPRQWGFERLADDPRYHDLLRRMNVPPPR